MCLLHFCKRAVCPCCTCEFYGTLLKSGMSPYSSHGNAEGGCKSGKKGPKSCFDSCFWTGLLPFSDLYIDSNIWVAWNIALFDLRREILSGVQFKSIFLHSCFYFQSYLLYSFQDTASLTLTSASLPSFEILLCTASLWCHTMPPTLILSSIPHAPLFHHHPATCSPSRPTASATPTHQEALLDQGVPISSQVRTSSQTSQQRLSRLLPGPGIRRQFYVLPPDCSYRLKCWTGWIWNGISWDCLLVLSPSF